MPRYLCLFLLLCSLGSTLCGCQDSNDSPELPRQWTVMVYVAADNDLDANIEDDLAEMTEARFGTEVTVIVQTDTRSSSGAQRWRIQSGRRTLLQDLGEVDMAKPATLTDFITSAVATSPAEHYALILWGHGNGWKSAPQQLARRQAMLNDWTDGGGRENAEPLGNHDIALAVRQAETAGSFSLDLLGIDACIMATMEAAYEFKDVAKILVSSQEVVPSQGWDYTTVLGKLGGNPMAEEEAFATMIVESYKDSMESASPVRSEATLSAIRLGTAIENYAVQVNRIAATMTTKLATDTGFAEQVKSARSTSQKFDPYTSPHTYVDLYDFVTRLKLADAEFNAAAQQILVAEHHGTDRAGATGLSIVFFDLEKAQAFSVYDSNYKNWDKASATGDLGGFINTYLWDESMHRWFDLAYPDLVHD